MSELPAGLLLWYQANKDTARPDELVLFDRLQMGTCMQCEFYNTPNVPGKLYHMNTRYEKELSNWTVECEPCRKETESYWDERWSEYWAGQL